MKEPQGIEKELMDWANDPMSSANTEDPVDSLEEEIRSLPGVVAEDDPSESQTFRYVKEEDVMRAIRHYRAKLWELRKQASRGEE